MDATTKSLRCGKGSGMRMGSRWQFGGLVESISGRRGWVVGASEWCSGVIAYEVGEEFAMA